MMSIIEIIIVCYLLVGSFLSGMYHEDRGDRLKYKWIFTIPITSVLMPIISAFVCLVEFSKWLWGHIEDKSKLPFLFRFYALKQFRKKNIEWLYLINVRAQTHFSSNSLNARRYRWAVGIINKHHGYVYDKEKSIIEYQEFLNKKEEQE